MSAGTCDLNEVEGVVVVHWGRKVILSFFLPTLVLLAVLVEPVGALGSTRANAAIASSWESRVAIDGDLVLGDLPLLERAGLAQLGSSQTLTAKIRKSVTFARMQPLTWGVNSPAISGPGFDVTGSCSRPRCLKHNAALPRGPPRSAVSAQEPTN